MSLVREYVFIVFTFHLVLVCFLFSFFSHFHEDITNLTEITCARRVAAGPGRVRVKIVISVTVTDSVYTGPSRVAEGVGGSTVGWGQQGASGGRI